MDRIQGIIAELVRLEDSEFVRELLEKEILHELLGPDRGRWRLMLNPLRPNRYLSVTTSLDAARQLFKLVFRGWIYRVAECSVSDDAWLIPDFNDPERGEALQKRFPDALKDPVEWFGTDVDLRPAGRPAMALCISMLLAKKKIMEVEKEAALVVAQ
jgi:hypothetical protein